MKVYLVWTGSYSDVAVQGVFLDKALALALAKELGEPPDSVEERELNDHVPKVYRYRVAVDMDGNLLFEDSLSPISSINQSAAVHSGKYRIMRACKVLADKGVYGYGEDLEEAIKNAQDFRRAYLASKASA